MSMSQLISMAQSMSRLMWILMSMSIENDAAKRTASLINQQINAAFANLIVDIDPIGIDALVVGLCALIFGIANPKVVLVVTMMISYCT